MRMNRILGCLPLLLLMPCLASGQSPTLQDIGGRASESTLPEIKIYTAKEIVTLDPRSLRHKRLPLSGIVYSRQERWLS